VQKLNGTTPKLNHATLAQQVYEHLRERILSNTYPPEAPLPEETLAAEFAVSRVPVREALRRLAVEGLVTLTPRQGAVVSSLSPKQFLDAYRVREALETLAIRLATPRVTPDDLRELDRLQEEMRRHDAAGDVEAFFAANAAFHLLLVDRADNADLSAIYAGLRDRLRRYRIPSLDLRGGLARSIDEHQAILDAVRAGDADAASRLLAEHIEVPQRVIEEASSNREQGTGNGEQEGVPPVGSVG
jgi:DNA-binding GntR family transcriptional regulator